MLTFVFITTVLYASTASASSLSSRSLLLHEKRDTHPTAFESQGPANPDTTLSLRISLAQSDIAGLKDKLMDISTPGNAAYGQHLSKEEVLSYISPKASAVDAIQGWLKENNLSYTQASPAGDWITFTASVEQANVLLDANFTAFTDTQTGNIAIRTLAYSLPATLKDHVDLVHPTVSFPGARQNIAVASQGTQQGGAPSSCDTNITPTCLQQRYGIPTTVATQQGNQIAVTGLGGIPANRTDLKMFLSSYRPDMPQSTTYTLDALDGVTNSTLADSDKANDLDEANLDVEYTVGLAQGVPVTFVTIADDDSDPWLDVALSLAAEATPPTVWTTSYGMAEESLSPLLANKICDAYATLGARGTSILFASGDGGISGPIPQNNFCSVFTPTFPSGCPYITSVGATQNIDPEVAAPFSSGGFSNYFSTPSYQTTAIAKYLQNIGSANAGSYNTSGRGYPDVAAIGQYAAVVSGGITKHLYGTSCSSPIFASVIALLNDELIAAGKPTLGFLNPWLYSTVATSATAAQPALNDITTGKNPGGPGGCDSNGFYTMSSWDPVTGLGTPNFAGLRAAAGLS